MRIIQITPGSGGTFYCENCLRDHGLVQALRRAGHEVLMVPLYLPILADGETGDESAVFFGGVNVYLQQKSGLFRRTPRWIDRWFDSPRLLKWVASRAGMTTARDLGETMLSMLRGEEGRQVKELDRLVEFLAAGDKPDVVSISNPLLAGIVRRIKDRLSAAVVCGLQDEDGFLDALDEPYRTDAWELMRRQAAEIDAFTSVSAYYAGVMRERLNLPDDRIRVVHCGLDASGYAPADAPPDPRAIGFLSQLCPAKGLHTLADAFVLLKRDGRFDDLKLRLAGGTTSAHEPYLAGVRGKLDEAGVGGDVQLLGNLDRAGRIEFLRTLSVLSVPSSVPEAFGLYILESLAAAVPVVQPACGASAELVEATGGGLLCEPNDAQSLADGLAELLDGPDEARALGAHGREVVLRDFHIDKVAGDFARVCESVMG